MTLFLQHSRRNAGIAVAIYLFVAASIVCAEWPSRLESYFWGGLVAGCAGLCLYIVIHRRRCVVSLVDDQLIWNTHAICGPPLSVRVGEIAVYVVESVPDSAAYRATLLLHASSPLKLSDFLNLEDHRRIFAAIAAVNPAIRWELRE